MSDLKLFMKKNKAVKENVKFMATKSLLDEKGTPLEWEIKPVSTKEDEEIRDNCTVEIPVAGKPNLFRNKVDVGRYIAKLITASVVFPDLYSTELQDSYGVKTPEDLLKEMLDDPGEYTEFAAFVQRFNGFDSSLDDKVEEAKN